MKQNEDEMSKIKKKKTQSCWHGGGTLTDLVVELRKLHLHFIPLEVVILCLLTHGRYQVELACN